MSALPTEGGSALADHLLRGVEGRATGRITVKGLPGGVLHLAGGLLVWVDVPGVVPPPVDAPLLTEPGLGGQVARLRLLADRLFALSYAQVTHVEFAPLGAGEPQPPVAGEMDAAASERLLREVERRREVLAGMPTAVQPCLDRVLLAGATPWARATLSAPEVELVDAVNGRRCCLEIAASLGRGVFATTVEVGRLVDAGVLALRPRAAAALDEEPVPQAATTPPRGTPAPTDLPTTNLALAPSPPSRGMVVIPPSKVWPVRELARRKPPVPNIGLAERHLWRHDALTPGPAVLLRVLDALRRL